MKLDELIAYRKSLLCSDLCLPEVRASSFAKVLAFWFQFFWIEGSIVVRFEIEVPLFQLSILKLIESDWKCLINGAVIMIEVLSHFGPMGDWGSVHDLSTNIGAVVFEPIGSYCTKLVFTLATPIVCGILNIHPPISGKCNSTRLIFAIWRFGDKAGLIGLRSMVLVSFWHDVPVVIVSEVPGHDRVIIDYADVDRVLEAASPDWRCCGVDC